jgi:hypothetical protein
MRSNQTNLSALAKQNPIRQFEAGTGLREKVGRGR